VVLFLLGGCGSSEEGEPAQAARPSQTEANTTAPGPRQNGKTPKSTAPEEVAKVVKVNIADGEVSPSGERVDVQVGQPIRLVVSSDTADEIHVHSSPEHSFAFKAGVRQQRFEFTLNQPGVVEAELHDLGDVLVGFAVRP
jgi:hypothetical protein